jgi:hypothetical protein
MYRKLNLKEIDVFAKKHLKEWDRDIEEVSLIKYGLTKEYLVNNHYLVIVKLFKVIHKDIQEYAR